MLKQNISRFAGLAALCVLVSVPMATLQHSSFAAQTKASKAKPKPTPGGANQVGGLTGKIGDMLFTGQWRFQAISISQAPTYTLTVVNSEQDYSKWSPVAEFDNASSTFTPKSGYDFYAVKCLVKNGQQSTEQLDCYGDDPKTALADATGTSYPPIVYDMHTQGPLTTKPMLPGSGQTITVLFAVDSGVKPQSLVFTLKNWSSRTGKNVRITLPSN